jgi:5'-nucleotidase
VAILGCRLSAREQNRGGKGGAAIDRAATYKVTVNNFLQGGGDNFTVFKAGTNAVVGPVDLEAFVSYVTTNLNHQITAVTENRITVEP